MITNTIFSVSLITLCMCINSEHLSHVKNFVHYHYYHPILYDTSHDIGKTYVNQTEAQILLLLDRCANPHYIPRVVSANQISWKKIEKAKSKKSESSRTHNISPAPSSSSADSHQRDSDGTTVHDYMAFAVLLPTHPFSYELLATLHIIAPMFPMVKIVIGNGYDFRNLCAQYGVTSFPQLLLFTKGILKGKYHLEIQPHIMAYEFSKWTESFPKCFPPAYHRHSGYSTTSSSSSLSLSSLLSSSSSMYSSYLPVSKKKASKRWRDFLHRYYTRLYSLWNHIYTWLSFCASQLKPILQPFMNMESSTCTLSDEGKICSSYLHWNHVIDTMMLYNEKMQVDIYHLLLKLRLPYSLEPVKGTIEELVEWDTNGYLIIISFSYMILRVIYFIYTCSKHLFRPT